MRIDDLVPGMMLKDVEGNRHTFVGRLPDHPLYPGLRLVVWRRSTGEWFHDALSGDMAVMVVGTIEPHDPEILRSNLERALLHPSQSPRSIDAAPMPPWADGWRAAIEWLEEQGELYLANIMKSRLPKEKK